MKRIGIMGGTFNPVHTGHLLLAECAGEEFYLDEIWLIPTGYSYKKGRTGNISPLDRYRMASLAAQENDKMKCLDVEIRREGATYSYETMEELKKDFPETDFYFIVGADCLFSVENWKYPERLFRCCHMIAAVREGAKLPEMEAQGKHLAEKYGADILLFPFRRLEISSTDIRERVRLGKSIRYLVPDKVRSFIEEKGFYKE